MKRPESNRLTLLGSRTRIEGDRKINTFEQQLAELKIFGFTVVEDVLPTSIVDEMRSRLAETDAQRGVESKHRGTAHHLANLIGIDPVYFTCIDHPRVLPLIEALMGKHLILGSLNARIVRPGDGSQGLHSDVPLPLHQFGAAAPIMMNTVWALDDFSAANGGTRVVPGSHQSGLSEPPPGFSMKYEQAPEIRAGSVLVINGQTWHGGGANATDRNRHALFGHYRYGEWFRFQCDPHHEFPEQWLALLTDRQKELLRMQHGLSHQLGADFYER